MRHLQLQLRSKQLLIIYRSASHKKENFFFPKHKKKKKNEDHESKSAQYLNMIRSKGDMERILKKNFIEVQKQQEKRLKMIEQKELMKKKTKK